MARRDPQPRGRWYRNLLTTTGAVLLLAITAYTVLVQIDALPNPIQRQPAPFPTPAGTRDGRWQQDIAYLATQLPYLHRNAFFSIPETHFRARAAELEAQVPGSSDVAILLGLAELAALIGDGHTFVELADPERLHTFPLQLAWFGDDLVVIGAHPDDRAALGARVTHIGDRTVEDALKMVAPLISHDNDQQLRNLSPRYLLAPEILVAVGLLETDTGRFRLETAGGATLTLELAPVRVDDPTKLLTLYDSGAITPPLRIRGDNPFYWYTYLPESQAIYIHYARCADDPDRPFVGFNRELFAFIDSHPVGRIVLDLRFNGGGNSRIFQPFLESLVQRPELNRPGQVYVLIGRQTFSSAMMNAIELKTRTNSILLGEPTGGRPNGYGEVRSFRLPNSGLRVQYSTRFFTNLPGSDAAALAPDLSYPISWEDLLAGRDPALEAALAGVRLP